MNKKITMFSLNASSSKSDFLCIKDALKDSEFFIGNMEVKEKNEIRSMLYEAYKLKESDSDWIGVEGFLPDEFIVDDKKSKKYLMLLPLDYLFRMKWSASQCCQLLAGYTHVIVPNDYWAEKIERYGASTGITIIKDWTFPFFEKVTQAEYIAENRKRLEKQFPQLTNKKLIYIYLPGQRANADRNDYTEIDLKGLLDAMPEEYTLVTNSINLRYAGRHLESSYRNKFIFVKGGNLRQELLTCAEGLLSNNAYACSVFASTGRPYSVVQLSDNGFEQYVIRNYPGTYIVNNRDMMENIVDIISGKYKNPEIDALIMQKGRLMVAEVCK